MEINENNQYTPKVNVTLKHKAKQKILKVEKKDIIKNNNLNYINIGKNINKIEDNNKQKNNNDIKEYELINQNKQIQNYSIKFNHNNIMKNNNLYQKNVLKELGDDFKENIYNTVDFQNIKIS